MDWTKSAITEMETGERDDLYRPDPLINDAYHMLTKLVIRGNEEQNEDLVVASQNLQDILDTL